MNDVCLSIITPSYNQSEYIEKNIKSVMSQDVSSLEHIIIDGGSTDGTVDILEQYEQEYNLKWISEPDQGQSNAINKGINMSSGEWIGWQNSDDYYLPDGTKIIEYPSENTDVVYGDMLVVDENEEVLYRKYNLPPSKFIQRNWRHTLSNQAMFIRKESLLELGGLSEEYNYTMDAELFYRLYSGNWNLEHIPENVGVLRKQPNAKTVNPPERYYKERNLVSEMYDRPPYEDHIPQTFLTAASILLAAMFIQRQAGIRESANMLTGIVKRQWTPSN